MAQKIIRHELVEMPVKAGSTITKYQIPDLPNLRNVHLYGVEVYYGNDRSQPGVIVNNGTVPVGIQTGLPVIDSPTVQKGFLTLVNYGGKEFLKQSPLLLYQSMFNGLPNGAINPLEWNTKSFVGQKCNFPKSYIEFTTSPANATQDTVIMFSVYYSLPIGEEQKESGFSFSKRA